MGSNSGLMVQAPPRWEGPSTQARWGIAVLNARNGNDTLTRLVYAIAHQDPH
jgi:hypothetical protein